MEFFLLALAAVIFPIVLMSICGCWGIGVYGSPYSGAINKRVEELTSHLFYNRFDIPVLRGAEVGS
jgi:hypothetical protein